MNTIIAINNNSFEIDYFDQKQAFQCPFSAGQYYNVYNAIDASYNYFGINSSFLIKNCFKDIGQNGFNYYPLVLGGGSVELSSTYLAGNIFYGGLITENYTLDCLNMNASLYILNSILIPSYVTVTLIHGCYLNFSANTGIRVEGNLILNGTKERFLKLSSNQNWIGIKVVLPNATLYSQYVTIENADYAIESVTSNLLIDSINLKNCKNGLYITNDYSMPVVTINISSIYSTSVGSTTSFTNNGFNLLLQNSTIYSGNVNFASRYNNVGLALYNSNIIVSNYLLFINMFDLKLVGSHLSINYISISSFQNLLISNNTFECNLNAPSGSSCELDIQPTQQSNILISNNYFINIATQISQGTRITIDSNVFTKFKDNINRNWRFILSLLKTFDSSKALITSNTFLDNLILNAVVIDYNYYYYYYQNDPNHNYINYYNYMNYFKNYNNFNYYIRNNRMINNTASNTNNSAFILLRDNANYEITYNLFGKNQSIKYDLWFDSLTHACINASYNYWSGLKNATKNVFVSNNFSRDKRIYFEPVLTSPTAIYNFVENYLFSNKLLCPTFVCDQFCNDRGNCTGANNCTCDIGYSGNQCERFYCANNCNNRGTCIGYNKCKCIPGWTLDECSQSSCNKTCSYQGMCAGDDNCFCYDGYKGVDCSQFACKNNCTQNQGSCIGPNVCLCKSGYTGQWCETPICKTYCNYRGKCIKPDLCKCAVGWFGNDCSELFCMKNCFGNGVCTGANTCNCGYSWFGAYCSEPLCLNKNSCSRHGYCYGDNLCACFDGYGGINCTSLACYNNCNNRGTCEQQSYCKCNSGFIGQFCETPLCLNRNNCSGNGYCSDADTCTCL